MSTFLLNAISDYSKWELLNFLDTINNFIFKQSEEIYKRIADRFIELDASSPLEKREIKELKKLSERNRFISIVLSRVGLHKIHQLNTDELIDHLGSGELIGMPNVFNPFGVRLTVYEFIEKKRSKELTETHIQQLSEYLKHEECDVRRRSVELLYNIPESYAADEELIKRCIDLLRDENELVTEGAANVLARVMKNQGLGSHIEQVIENLNDLTWTVQMAACYFFEQIASVFPEDSHLFERVTMKLGKLLKVQSMNVRSAADSALEKIWEEQGNRYVKLINSHIKSLGELDYSEDYLCSIAKYQSLNESHIESLKGLLDHPEYWVQAKAVKILCEVALEQENNEELVQAFIEKLKSEDELVRKRASDSLHRINKKLTYKQIEQMCECLKSRDAAVRHTVEDLINWLSYSKWSSDIVEILKKLKETSESKFVQNILKRMHKE